MSACGVYYLGTHVKRGGISWPNIDLVFDLADWGSLGQTPGTKVRTTPRHAHGCPAHIRVFPVRLRFSSCVSNPANRASSGTTPAAHPPQSTTASSKPAVLASSLPRPPLKLSRSRSVTEERDYITTTRTTTTTTTTITTTTEIKKMPRWMLQHTCPKSSNRRSIGYRLA